MKFLRIGNTVINPAAIAKVDLYSSFGEGSHYITLLSQDSNLSEGGSQELMFAIDSKEGQAIAAYFDSPDNVLKISGVTDEEEQFYWYQSVGGKLDYYNWLGRFRKHQQLMEIESLNEEQLKIIQRLESELLY